MPAATFRWSTDAGEGGATAGPGDALALGDGRAVYVGPIRPAAGRAVVRVAEAGRDPGSVWADDALADLDLELWEPAALPGGGALTLTQVA